MMRNKSDLAIDQFRTGLNCAQSVFLAFANQLDIDRETAIKIASGFGAGMGREQETCGAISGAVMVLGLMNTHPNCSIKENKKAAYIATSDFINQFKEKFGSTKCLEILLDCDLKTEEGRNFYNNKNLFEEKCIPCVQAAVQMLGSRLNDEDKT